MLSTRFLILFFLLLSAGTACADPVVSVLLTDQKAANVEFAAAFRKSLKRIAPLIEVKETGAIDSASPEHQKVIVAVGSQSFQKAIQESRSPVVGALLPRFSYERLQSQANQSVAISAVFLDQPEERQLAFLSILPGPPGVVGVLQTATSVVSLTRLRSGATKFRLKINEEVISPGRDIGAVMQTITGQSDIILATPDPDIFNPQTIQGILLSAYRARVPLIGFSPAYTRAGALASLHSSVSQLAEQTAEMVRLIVQTDTVPPPQVPAEFEVSVNRQVARSMGIDLPAEAILVERIKSKVKAP